MLSIDFLKSGVAGQEFMDFQKTSFYDVLTACAEKHITDVDGVSMLSEEFGKEAAPIFEKYTGFNNFTFQYPKDKKVNLGVDVGYFSPKHVFNNGLDGLLKVTETTLYRWFQENKVKVFKASIDYKTGKVDGSFKTLPVLLLINPNLNNTFSKELVAKTGVPIAGLLAGACAHELGHVYGGCMMLFTAVSDNLIAKAAVRHYSAAQTTEDRIIVLKDSAALLEIDPAKLEELRAIANNPSEDSFILYWNKLLTQRNRRRSLSVGVETMSSEVVADMYAIRMGCHKGVVAAISVLVDKGIIESTVDTLMFATIMTICTQLFTFPLLAAINPGFALVWIGITFATMFVIGYFSRGYSGIYNADHRRLEDATRQLLAKLREDPHMGSKERAELAEEIEKLVALGKKLKPWYDNTAVGRAMGYVFSGADFKKQEIEHYTQALANNEISVIGLKLAALRNRRDGTDRTPEENKTYEF